MPASSLQKAEKNCAKPKISLSLNRKNGVLQSRGNGALVHSKATKKTLKDQVAKKQTDEFKENIPTKRSLEDPEKDLLPKKPKLLVFKELEVVIRQREIQAVKDMLNGHQSDEETNGASLNKKTPIGSLSNLGNTCFLNSVLYTLRFAPRFLHHLHHLVCDLAMIDQKLSSIRIKSSSLGRATASLASSSPRSWSTKDLLSLGQIDTPGTKNKNQIVTERLHETFASVTLSESKSTDNNPEPTAADSFLSALREVNSTFEGNRQQDAHELLVCVLDCIRETCKTLRTKHTKLAATHAESMALARSDSGKGSNGSRNDFAGLRKSWKRRRDPQPFQLPEVGKDFVTEDFEGVTVQRTTCAECETQTERKEAIFDICVPVGECGASGGTNGSISEDDRDPFRLACTSSECLRDQNKYWCECCLRYNEARRSVSYERLPKLLVLHLKRFSGGMEKITAHHPTPLELACFCESCCRQESNHRYSLWAVVVHHGQTLSGGHYVAYARVAEGNPGVVCNRSGPEPKSGGLVRALLGTTKSPRPCAANTCCAAPKTQWLHCDDEVVQPISCERLREVLSENKAAATPYLLFYAKNEDS